MAPRGCCSQPAQAISVPPGSTGNRVGKSGLAWHSTQGEISLPDQRYASIFSRSEEVQPWCPLTERAYPPLQLLKGMHQFRLSCPKNMAAVQSSGCRECHSLSGSGWNWGNGCVRHEQVAYLLTLVVELSEEADRLRNIRVGERVWHTEAQCDLLQIRRGTGTGTTKTSESKDLASSPLPGSR